MKITVSRIDPPTDDEYTHVEKFTVDAPLLHMTNLRHGNRRMLAKIVDISGADVTVEAEPGEMGYQR